MFSALKKNRKSDLQVQYEDIVAQARNPHLYTDYNVPDTPQGRFQMIALHAAPVMIAAIKNGRTSDSQILFDLIFKDIEQSFREIGVGDLAVPKKMKRYMQDFNGLLRAHEVATANHAAITGRSVFGDETAITPDFKTYIERLYAS
jgi:cytochrome b pre-mRNA-processing protein 3